MRIDSSGNVDINAGVLNIGASRGTYIDASEDSSATGHIFVSNDDVGDFSQLAGNLILQARIHPTVYRDIIFAGGLNTAEPLMTIQGEGNVGIGTTSPDASLDIEPSSGDADILLTAGSQTLRLDQNSIRTTTDSNLTLFTNGNSGQLVLKQSNGNVGIGTTSPATKLQVKDSQDSSFDSGISVVRSNAGSQVGYINMVGGAFNFNTISALPIKFRHGGNTDVTISGAGYVGIGTTSPSTPLDISSDSNSSDNIVELINTKYGSTDTAGETGILFGWSNHSAARITAFKEGTVNRTGFKIIGEAGYNVPTTIATFRSTGRVGIGVNSPAAKLQVGATQSTSANGISFAAGASVGNLIARTTTHHNWLPFSDGSNYYSADNHIFRNPSHSTEWMRVASSGRVFVNNNTYSRDAFMHIEGNSNNYALYLYAPVQYASNYRYQRFWSGNNIAGGIEGTNQTSVTYTTSSDYRMKKNIKPLENGLDRVCKLKPVKFDWKLNDELTEGFIAHEVQEIFPYAVTGEKDGEGMQGMDYGRITPLLVKAIQELKAEIETLKLQING
jgi:hypothetical protein